MPLCKAQMSALILPRLWLDDELTGSYSGLAGLLHIESDSFSRRSALFPNHLYARRPGEPSPGTQVSGYANQSLPEPFLFYGNSPK